MALSIFGHVIWHPQWDVDKKIGIAVTVVATFSILLVVLTFVTVITIDTKQMMTLELSKSNNESDAKASSASRVGKI